MLAELLEVSIYEPVEIVARPKSIDAGNIDRHRIEGTDQSMHSTWIVSYNYSF